MKLERTMFREYDIRGRVNDQEMNETSVEFVGTDGVCYTHWMQGTVALQKHIRVWVNMAGDIG